MNGKETLDRGRSDRMRRRPVSRGEQAVIDRSHIHPHVKNIVDLTASQRIFDARDLPEEDDLSTITNVEKILALQANSPQWADYAIARDPIGKRAKLFAEAKTTSPSAITMPLQDARVLFGELTYKAKRSRMQKIGGVMAKAIRTYDRPFAAARKKIEAAVPKIVDVLIPPPIEAKWPEQTKAVKAAVSDGAVITLKFGVTTVEAVPAVVAAAGCMVPGLLTPTPEASTAQGQSDQLHNPQLTAASASLIKNIEKVMPAICVMDYSDPHFKDFVVPDTNGVKFAASPTEQLKALIPLLDRAADLGMTQVICDPDSGLFLLTNAKGDKMIPVKFDIGNGVAFALAKAGLNAEGKLAPVRNQSVDWVVASQNPTANDFLGMPHPEVEVQTFQAMANEFRANKFFAGQTLSFEEVIVQITNNQGALEWKRIMHIKATDQKTGKVADYFASISFNGSKAEVSILNFRETARGVFDGFLINTNNVVLRINQNTGKVYFVSENNEIVLMASADIVRSGIVFKPEATATSTPTATATATATPTETPTATATAIAVEVLQKQIDDSISSPPLNDAERFMLDQVPHPLGIEWTGSVEQLLKMTASMETHAVLVTTARLSDAYGVDHLVAFFKFEGNYLMSDAEFASTGQLLRDSSKRDIFVLPIEIARFDQDAKVLLAVRPSRQIKDNRPYYPELLTPEEMQMRLNALTGQNLRIVLFHKVPDGFNPEPWGEEYVKIWKGFESKYTADEKLLRLLVDVSRRKLEQVTGAISPNEVPTPAEVEQLPLAMAIETQP